MSIYTISDLHLALSIDKPMDVFGARWKNYMEKLKIEWEKTVTRDDVVIIPGDISWATYLGQVYQDLNFIELLPGKKIISKGNHDYWWTTRNKLDIFLSEKNFSTISFMHNNSFKFGNIILCGTRGWKCPGDDDFSMEDDKIFKREYQRLEISLKSAEKTSEDQLIVALHYPPFNSRKQPSQLVELMSAFGVKTCVYGHLHGEGFKNAIEGPINGIEFRLVSADYLNFKPLKLF